MSDAGVDTTEVPSLRDPAILARLEAFVGKPFSFGDLHAINRAVIAFMRSHGRPLVDVAVPAQDVTGGVVQIVVTEFRLEEIRIAHNRWFSKSAIRSGFGAARGQPIDLDRLQRDLDWVNRNPFRRVDAVFARGVATGTTDIQLDVQDRFPLRVYAGFDNSGTPATGRDRWSLGVNFGNLFDRDVQLSYQFMAGDDFLRHIADGKSRFLAHSASVLVPLAWHGLVEVFGSYVRQSPDVGPFFGQVGYSAQISGRYVQLLDGPPWLSQELQAGFDYKTTDNNLAFGGTQVFSASEDVAQFLATYSASAADPWGVTTLGNDLVVSPGGLTAGNTTAAFARSGTSFARAGYVYDTLTLARTTLLPYGAHSTTRLTAQYADGNLLPSEQLGGGGEESVRGYDPRAVNGSEGLLVREELHSPSFRPARLDVRSACEQWRADRRLLGLRPSQRSAYAAGKSGPLRAGKRRGGLQLGHRPYDRFAQRLWLATPQASRRRAARRAGERRRRPQFLMPDYDSDAADPPGEAVAHVAEAKAAYLARRHCCGLDGQHVTFTREIDLLAEWKAKRRRMLLMGRHDDVADAAQDKHGNPDLAQLRRDHATGKGFEKGFMDAAVHDAHRVDGVLDRLAVGAHIHGRKESGHRVAVPSLIGDQPPRLGRRVAAAARGRGGEQAKRRETAGMTYRRVHAGEAAERMARIDGSVQSERAGERRHIVRDGCEGPARRFSGRSAVPAKIERIDREVRGQTGQKRAIGGPGASHGIAVDEDKRGTPLCEFMDLVSEPRAVYIYIFPSIGHSRSPSGSNARSDSRPIFRPPGLAPIRPGRVSPEVPRRRSHGS
ncbi:MAG: ShlB/FhaC/HecB family hemolysin secretion/activation protein [Rhizomicrobium sp.]